MGTPNHSKELGSEEEELDRLYGLPLGKFVEARDELARRYREAGERARASRVKELVKPSVSAWLVNQLARRRELDVRRLVNAGAQLEQAQRAAVEGKATEDFAAARREEAGVVQRLLEAAREIGAASEHSPSAAVIQRVGASLRAAAATKEGRAALMLGRLEGDLEPTGFDALGGVAARPRTAGRPERTQPQPAAPARRLRPSAADEQKRARAQARLEKAESELSELTARWRALEREAKDAEQLSRKKRRGADDARSRADRAQERIERLRREAAAARAR